MKNSNILGVFAVLFVICALMLVGSMDYEDAILEEQRYCTDVVIWRTNQMTTGSQSFGHPDYKGIYDVACAKYQYQDSLLITGR